MDIDNMINEFTNNEIKAQAKPRKAQEKIRGANNTLRVKQKKDPILAWLDSHGEKYELDENGLVIPVLNDNPKEEEIIDTEIV